MNRWDDAIIDYAQQNWIEKETGVYDCGFKILFLDSQ